MKKFHEKIQYIYFKEEENTEKWANTVNRMKEKGYDITDIGNVAHFEKYIIFEKFYD
jgi:hypothetical protein